MEYAISELLINDLSRSEGLTIINNQTIFEVIQNVGSTRTSTISNDLTEDIASRVMVESYIYGSYLLAGSTFRITLAPSERCVISKVILSKRSVAYTLRSPLVANSFE